MRRIAKTVLIFLVVSISNLCSQEKEGKEELPAHALPVLQNWLHQNSEVVEVCVFREEWTPPREKFSNGILKRFATITYVHKGSVKVGERIQMTALIEFPRSEWREVAKKKPSKVSMVDGELMVAMFDKKGTPQENGYWLIGHDICRFLFTDYFYQAFLMEKKRDSKLRGISN